MPVIFIELNNIRKTRHRHFPKCAKKPGDAKVLEIPNWCSSMSVGTRPEVE